MTYNLRPAAQRVLTVEQEQLLQAGKRLEGDQQTRTFKNGRNGYTGAALNPWRTGKSQVKRLVRDSKGVRYTNDDGSAKAKGLPPVTKEVDNSGDCVGGCPEWTAKDRKAAAEQNEKTWAANGCETATPWQTEVKETLPTGLRNKYRLVGVGATDKQWVGQLKTPVTAQAKPVAYDRTQKTYEIGVAYWYEVERVEGFVPATTKERDAACLEQLKCYTSRPQKVVYDVATCLAKGKYEAKGKALDNALRCAFRPRVKTASDTALSLSTTPIDGEEASWTPTTADRMVELAEAAEAYQTQQLMRRILARMTDKQREAIELKAMGIQMTSTQRRHLQMAREKASLKG